MWNEEIVVKKFKNGDSVFIYTLKITIDWVTLDFYGKVPLFYKILVASQH